MKSPTKKTINLRRNKILALESVVRAKANTENKKGVRLSLAERKALIKDKGVVERIYITRGHDQYDEANVLCDKFSGLLINDEIYWIEGNFARPSELSEMLEPLGIGMNEKGSWGWGEDRETIFDSSLVKVETPQDEMFEEGSRWIEKAVWADKENDRLSWTIEELQLVLLAAGKAEKEAS